MSRNDIYIGLMSGTSVDAIDAVAVRFPQANSVDLIATHSHPIPDDIKTEIIALNHVGENDELHRTMSLDITLGEIFAEAALTLLKHNKISKDKICAIGSHGQTIRHQIQSKPRYTLQIGNPHALTELTGITTVSDFRMRDVFLDGQGAPLVPAFHKALFSCYKNPRIILNIGGMANVTFLWDKEKIQGFDTGPGNVLLDYWYQKNNPGAFDNNGQWAKSGTPDSQLIKDLLSEDFFSQHPPKSTGRELFDGHWLEQKLLNHSLKPNDIQASILQLTIESISIAIKNWGPTAGEVFVCGGGANNMFLIKQLAKQLVGHTIDSTLKLGLDPNWVEACAFAWFAKQTIEHKPVDFKDITGAKKNSIAGGVYFSTP